MVSWLGEDPQPSTWPAYTVLDDLGCSIASRDIPLKLFALLHRALTHPAYVQTVNPSFPSFPTAPAQSLSRLERHLTRAAAPALDQNAEESGLAEKSQRKIDEVASCGGQVGDLFQFLSKLLAFAWKVRKSGTESMGSSGLLELESQSKDLSSSYKSFTDIPGIGWSSVFGLVAGLIQDLDDIIKENMKAARQREARKKQEETSQRLVAGNHRVDEDARVVLSLLAGGRLLQRSPEGLKGCLARMKRLGDSMQELEKLKAPKPLLSTDAWEAGRKAIQSYCQMRLRCSKAFHWLQARQLGHCAKLLNSASLLECLDLLREEKEAQRLKALGAALSRLFKGAKAGMSRYVVSQT